MGFRLPPPDVIAVDVDGTLFRPVPGQREMEANADLITWIRERKAEGFTIMIWSLRGQEYAQDAVDLAGIGDVVDLVLSKPGYVVDDTGWNWIRETLIVPGFTEQ
ncbi:hypothetical protein [Desulfonatronum thiodismutans]|uniref:hypothetical protein n=1 Tax=Desulfonatronum thiodismutans TaxID=159290 RepID=UPI0004ABEA70|nr:hypothetical protein [Desulfonatronum thiodismutans]